MANGSRPYGNDFFVSTPKLDQLEHRLYNEQLQAEQYRRQQLKALDDEFSKNVSNIRDADVDDLTKVYGDYKTATQGLMRQKNGATPQQQLEVLRKKADLYKLINESKAEKEREEMIAKRYAIKPDDFTDNASELIITGRGLPLSKKRTYKSVGQDGKETEVDLTNPEHLMYQDKTNWVPVLQKAGGTLVPRGNPIIKAIPGGLEQEEISFKAGNDPVEFYNVLVGSMNTARAAGSLAKRFPFSPEEAATITATFEELKKQPEFKQVYGDIKFPESANLTEGTKTAKLLAMQNAINNPPTATKKNVAIRDAIMTRREKFAREIQSRIDSRSFSLANLRRSWQVQDQKAQDEYLDEVMIGFEKTGKVDPQIVKDYSIKDDKGHPVEINKVVISPDGSTYDFLVTDSDGKVYEDYSTRGVPKSNVRARARKELETQTTNTAVPNPKSKTQTNQTPKRKVNW